MYTLEDLLQGRSGVLEVAFPVIDIMMCSQAHTLILNQFSTFSNAIFKMAMWRNATVSPTAVGRSPVNYKKSVAYAWIQITGSLDKVDIPLLKGR